jgi:CBS-domain-containing membrane protein
MSRQLFSCSPEQSISSAESLMRSCRIRRVPVLDGNQRLVGIISLADIVTRGHSALGRSAVNDLAATEIATTLANICQPRQIGAAEAAQL